MAIWHYLKEYLYESWNELTISYTVTRKMIDNILEVLRGTLNSVHVKRDDNSLTHVRNELIRHTISVLFKTMEAISLQIENASDMLTDIEKLKIELSWVWEEIANIEKALDTLIDNIDISKIDELENFPDRKLTEDYCNFLHFLRHDIVCHLMIIRSFFIDIDMFISKADLLMREIKRLQMVKKRINTLISSLESNFEDFDLYSVITYIKSAHLN